MSFQPATLSRTPPPPHPPQSQLDFLLGRGLSQVWAQGHIPGSPDLLVGVVGWLWVLPNVLLHQLPTQPYVTVSSYVSCTLDYNFLARRDCDLTVPSWNYLASSLVCSILFKIILFIFGCTGSSLLYRLSLVVASRDQFLL